MERLLVDDPSKSSVFKCTSEVPSMMLSDDSRPAKRQKIIPVPEDTLLALDNHIFEVCISLKEDDKKAKEKHDLEMLVLKAKLKKLTEL